MAAIARASSIVTPIGGAGRRRCSIPVRRHSGRGLIAVLGDSCDLRRRWRAHKPFVACHGSRYRPAAACVELAVETHLDRTVLPLPPPAHDHAVEQHEVPEPSVRASRAEHCAACAQEVTTLGIGDDRFVVALHQIGLPPAAEWTAAARPVRAAPDVTRLQRGFVDAETSIGGAEARPPAEVPDGCRARVEK